MCNIMKCIVLQKKLTQLIWLGETKTERLQQYAATFIHSTTFNKSLKTKTENSPTSLSSVVYCVIASQTMQTMLQWLGIQPVLKINRLNKNNNNNNESRRNYEEETAAALKSQKKDETRKDEGRKVTKQTTLSYGLWARQVMKEITQKLYCMQLSLAVSLLLSFTIIHWRKAS